MNKKQRLNIFRVVLIGSSSISLFFVPWILVKAWILPLPDTLQEQVDQTLGHGFDGIIVYVDEGGKAPAWYTAGWHDKENKIPAKPHALFKIASISKLYDAVAITKLVHAGSLSLDNTLADYFPELVGRIEYADQITLRMMIQHRSGIPNLTDTPNFWNEPPKSSQAALELVLDLPADFKPNQKYRYSNTNYLLLSMLVEKQTGKSNFEYIKEQILMPLKLEHTYGSIHDLNLGELMSGYYVGIENDIKTTDYGSMVATAEDVGTFLRALNDGSVFTGGEAEIYASLYEYGHGGLIPGYQSMARYHQDIDAVVIQFMNTTKFDGYHWNLLQITYNRVVKILRRGR
jgi:CubicO group peptidase (beta-lactamase class C family)